MSRVRGAAGPASQPASLALIRSHWHRSWRPIVPAAGIGGPGLGPEEVICWAKLGAFSFQLEAAAAAAPRVGGLT